MAKRQRIPTVSTDSSIYGEDPLFEIDSPEKRLLFAILKRALEDCAMPERMIINKLNQNAIRHIQSQAEFWLRNYSSQEVGSVRWILEYVSNDPDSAHKSVLKLLAQADLKDWLTENCLTHRVYPIVRKKPARKSQK